MSTLRDRFAAALMPNYGLPPLALTRGQGCRVWDEDGNEYLDLIAGIAVSSLGHAHPAVVDAVTRQVATIAHTSNLFVNEPAVQLAERLISLIGHNSRVFFANSGAEANEAALKLVRRHHGSASRRPVIVAAHSGFHGRTMGALAVTGKPSIREPFAPFGFDVRFVPFGDAAALKEAVGGTVSSDGLSDGPSDAPSDVAAVIVEPCLGEGGVIPAPVGYLAAAREICDQNGALLVVDEVQSGIGRTGAWFAFEREGVLPDVLTLAKGLGGGLPIGACIGIGALGTAFGPGDHGSTFGGNPVACAAALAVLDTVDLAHVTSVGERLSAGLSGIDHPLLAGVRGTGLLLAAALTSNTAPQVEQSARRHGFLVNAVQPDAIRLAPPLILTAAEVDRFVAAFPAILDGVDS
jgi:acetylornithine/N-succinyldiaminopimelate aminotransferase